MQVEGEDRVQASRLMTYRDVGFFPPLVGIVFKAEVCKWMVSETLRPQTPDQTMRADTISQQE